jgi:plasmid maintenance system antidote protein VapI
MKMKNRSELFRAQLQIEFEKRQNKKGKYPMRAFAQSLGIDASSLHNIMSGERRAGPQLIRRLGLIIGLTEKELEEILEHKGRT